MSYTSGRAPTADTSMALLALTLGLGLQVRHASEPVPSCEELFLPPKPEAPQRSVLLKCTDQSAGLPSEEHFKLIDQRRGLGITMLTPAGNSLASSFWSRNAHRVGSTDSCRSTPCCVSFRRRPIQKENLTNVRSAAFWELLSLGAKLIGNRCAHFPTLP
jgi:hypothetical protein